ncbi:MAG: UDP-N-acetylmuramate--L-alanine ligase [Negativicutes bacterium]
MLENIKRIHFIGLGGIGMSGLAQVLNWRGFAVSGSDTTPSALLDKMANQGIEVMIGHDANNIGLAEALVVSSAIAVSNPELMLAKAKGLPVFHRSDVLAYIMAEKTAIAVAGTHGKTTTTALLGVVLKAGGFDPTVVVGGVVNSLGGNVIVGDGKYCVAEADESDGSFLKLPKALAIITNIEADHMEHYKTMDNLLNAFRQFLSTLPVDGLAVLCADDERVMAVRSAASCKVITYSLQNNYADISGSDLEFSGGHAQFTITAFGKIWGRAKLGVPGKYNVANALAVAAIAIEFGVEFTVYAQALENFVGANRRFQIKGEVNNVLVVDDYAHHPTEINAALTAAAEIGRTRVVCAFQPHRYSRTQSLQKEFGRCFDSADLVVLTDIYPASEQPIPGIDGSTIPKEYQAYSGKAPLYVGEFDKLPQRLAEIVRPGDIVLTMGAGSITGVGDKLLELLKAK